MTTRLYTVHSAGFPDKCKEMTMKKSAFLLALFTALVACGVSSAGDWPPVHTGNHADTWPDANRAEGLARKENGDDGFRRYPYAPSPFTSRYSSPVGLFPRYPHPAVGYPPVYYDNRNFGAAPEDRPWFLRHPRNLRLSVGF